MTAADLIQLQFHRRVHKIVKIHYWLRHVWLSVRPSVRME